MELLIRQALLPRSSTESRSRIPRWSARARAASAAAQSCAQSLPRSRQTPLRSACRECWEHSSSIISKQQQQQQRGVCQFQVETASFSSFYISLCELLKPESGAFIKVPRRAGGRACTSRLKPYLVVAVQDVAVEENHRALRPGLFVCGGGLNVKIEGLAQHVLEADLSVEHSRLAG